MSDDYKGYYGITTKTDAEQGRVFGESKISNDKSAFPNSPIHKGELTDQERFDTFVAIVMTGNIDTVGGEGIKGGGNGFTSVSRDYSDHPDLPDIPNITKDSDDNDLLSPYMPNISSPGPGMSDSTKPMYAGEIPNRLDQNEFGSGNIGTFNPKNSSVFLSKNQLGAYIKGRSYDQNN